MRLDDYERLTIEKFMGWYSRGLTDQVPPDHSRCCQNVVFKPGEVSTREGVIKYTDYFGHQGIRRMFLATKDDTTLTVLSLGNNGIYIGNSSTPMYSAAGMEDFAGLNINNRTYLTASDGQVGVGGQKVQVWLGGSVSRDAGGATPVGSVLIAADGAAGSVDIGTHKIAVAYETDTGFITPPGPKFAGTFAPAVYIAPGSKKIDLANIPVGPAYVVARHIIVTKANEEEYFFVSGGRIPNNTATLATIDFFDSDLVISADYLFDLLESITAGVGLAKYHGRMLVWGGEGDLIRVSRIGEPESFSSVDGFIQLPSERDGNTVRSSFQLRDVLYFSKFPGIYAFQDNGEAPSLWTPIDVDAAVGSFLYGVSTITGSQTPRAYGDLVLLADKYGLMLFDGRANPVELTWKIQDFWDRITFARWHRITVQLDIWTKRIYVIAPVDGALEPNAFIMGDFSEALTSDGIKWNVWLLPFPPLTIAMMFLLVDGRFRLRIGHTDNHLYSPVPGATDDFGNAIDSFYCTYHAYFSPGFLNLLTALRFRALGRGDLKINIVGEDQQIKKDFLPLPLQLLPGQELTRLTNYTSEKISVQFGTDKLAEKFTVDRVDLYGLARWGMRPA